MTGEALAKAKQERFDRAWVLLSQRGEELIESRVRARLDRLAWFTSFVVTFLTSVTGSILCGYHEKGIVGLVCFVVVVFSAFGVLVSAVEASRLSWNIRKEGLRRNCEDHAVMEALFPRAMRDASFHHVVLAKVFGRYVVLERDDRAEHGEAF